MTAAERGLLLLCCTLGQDTQRPLSAAQLRLLRNRTLAAGPQLREGTRQLHCADFLRLGYDEPTALHIVQLLDRDAVLDGYLRAGARMGIVPVTRLSPDYPGEILKKRGSDAPPVFFCAGNLSLFHTSCVAVVGSRKLTQAGMAFAGVAGMLAAREGITLVTGGAEGADSTALAACLRGNGSAVVFVPDMLSTRKVLASASCLVCSEHGYDLPFSTIRAFSRNSCIHMLAGWAMVAQTACGTGGTWGGAIENLKRGWSDVYVNDDGSDGAAALVRHGATPVGELTTIAGLRPAQQSLF